MLTELTLDHVLGRGLYTRKDIQQFTQLSFPKTRHWIRGDARKASQGRNRVEPIVDCGYERLDGEFLLSFLALIELKVIGALRDAGVSLQSVRRSHSEAKKFLTSDHPFATNRIWTDGRAVFARVGKETHDQNLLNLVNRQQDWRKITEDFLKAIEVSASDVAIRWWPLSRERLVVIDPERNFGHPVLSGFGVPTLGVAQAYVAEESYEKVAWWFDITSDAVKDAVEYEKTVTKRIH